MNDTKLRHGGPYDRGLADAYYRRGYHPHCYVGATYSSERVEEDQLTPEELVDYNQGYQEGVEDRSYRKELDYY